MHAVWRYEYKHSKQHTTSSILCVRCGHAAYIHASVHLYMHIAVQRAKQTTCRLRPTCPQICTCPPPTPPHPPTPHHTHITPYQMTPRAPRHTHAHTRTRTHTHTHHTTPNATPHTLYDTTPHTTLHHTPHYTTRTPRNTVWWLVYGVVWCSVV